MADGTTPFIVFVRREGKKRKHAGPKRQLEQNVEVIRIPTQYKLYLSSDTGYLTIPMFQCIMDHFTKWWTEGHPSFDCYLISDNLRVHINKSVIEFA